MLCCDHMAKPLAADDRRSIAEKIMELGNLTVAGFVIGQFVGVTGFNWWLAVIGLVLFVEFYAVAYWLMKGGGR